MRFATGYTPFVTAVNASGMDEEEFPVTEAMYYKKLPDIRVECELCPRGCKVADLERGYCGVREIAMANTIHLFIHAYVQ